MTSFLTTVPSTPLAIAMPDEFSDVTDIMVNRGNLISTSPATQSVSTKQVNTKTGSTTLSHLAPDGGWWPSELTQLLATTRGQALSFSFAQGQDYHLTVY